MSKNFEPSVKGKSLVLNDNIFDPFIDDFEKKVDPPTINRIGRSSVFYIFERTE